ncbi:enoyl-CoA hydratase-related protein [Burkholderia sp. BCC1998]|uniref:enoyl-CoA hydratase-related protein n=1 Tax=Burkholderia sp. BCC1998 TaxID=2817447 RepID=UPI002AB5E8E8|nr:enoyl-CoA hydratase-related protein [Burkholderia sp. BCC1998]
MTEDALLYEATGAVARLTLNRPKAMNAMNIALLTELDRRLAQIADDDGIRVVVLTGAGPALLRRRRLVRRGDEAGRPDCRKEPHRVAAHEGSRAHLRRQAP